MDLYTSPSVKQPGVRVSKKKKTDGLLVHQRGTGDAGGILSREILANSCTERGVAGRKGEQERPASGGSARSPLRRFVGATSTAVALVLRPEQGDEMQQQIQASNPAGKCLLQHLQPLYVHRSSSRANDSFCFIRLLSAARPFQREVYKVLWSPMQP